MPTDDLRVRIRLIDSRLAQLEAERTGKAIQGVGRSAQTAGRHAKESAGGFGLFGRAMGGLKFALAATGIGGLVFGIKDAISAGQQWQQQQAQLRVALKNTGQAVGPTLERLNKEIERSSTHGGFALQDESQGLAQFVRLTGNATSATKLNASAVDLARGAHLGYAQAVRMLSQIQTGNTGRLQRYIGILQPVHSHVQALTAEQKKLNPQVAQHAALLDKQATAAKANQLILQKYGGATSAYSHTAAGALENAKHSFELLAEQLGRYFLPYVADAARALAAFAPKVGRAFRSVIEWIKGSVHWLKEHKTAATALIAVAAALAAGFMVYRTIAKIIRIVEAAQLALNLAMEANPVILIISAIVALGVAFVVLYKRSETFRHGVQALFRWLKTAAQNVAHAVAAAFQFIANIASSVASFIARHWKLLVIVLTGPFGAAAIFIGTHLRAISNAVSATVHWVAGAMKWLADKLTWPFRQMAKAAKAAFGWVKGAVHDVGGFFSHPFGIHFATGGLVPGFAGGGPVGDNVPARLTPGEFVLRRQVVSAVGVQNLQRLNAGGALPTAQAAQFEPGVTKVYINAREVARAMTQYTLKQQARK